MAKIPDLGGPGIGVEVEPIVRAIDIAENHCPDGWFPRSSHRGDRGEAKRMRTIADGSSEFLPDIRKEKMEIVGLKH
jgi:hypothetical protein